MSLANKMALVILGEAVSRAQLVSSRTEAENQGSLAIGMKNSPTSLYPDVCLSRTGIPLRDPSRCQINRVLLFTMRLKVTNCLLMHN